MQMQATFNSFSIVSFTQNKYAFMGNKGQIYSDKSEFVCFFTIKYFLQSHSSIGWLKN